MTSTGREDKALDGRLEVSDQETEISAGDFFPQAKEVVIGECLWGENLSHYIKLSVCITDDIICQVFLIKICVCVGISVCTHLYVCVCVHACMHMCIRKYVCMCVGRGVLVMDWLCQIVNHYNTSESPDSSGNVVNKGKCHTFPFLQAPYCRCFSILIPQTLLLPKPRCAAQQSWTENQWLDQCAAAGCPSEITYTAGRTDWPRWNLLCRHSAAGTGLSC